MDEMLANYDAESGRKIRANMEKCADFMARMIEKYGDHVLEEMAAEKPTEIQSETEEITG